MPLALSPREKGQNIVHLLVLLAMFAFQAIHLDSDPSPLAWPHEINDEGFWNHSARSKVLFDSFVPDEFNQGVIAAPLFTLIEWPIFSVFGVSLFSARLLPVASLWLILLMLYFLIRRGGSAQAALLTVVMLGLLHEMLFYSKWSTPVLPEACFLVAVLFFWEWGKRGNRWWLAAAGASYVAAALTTLLALHCLLGILYFLAAEWWLRKEVDRRGAAIFLGTIAALGVLVLLGHYLPNYEQVRIFVQTIGRANVTKASDFIGSTYVREPVYALPFLMPFSSPGAASMMMMATLWMVDSILRMVRDGAAAALRRMSAVELYCLCWILGAMPSIMAVPYMPPRRFVIFLVPLTVLASSMAWRVLESRIPDAASKILLPQGLPRILAWGFVVVVWCAYVWRSEFALNARWFYSIPWALPQEITIAACLAAVALAACYFFAGKTRATMLVLLAYFFTVNLLLTAVWYAHPTYTMRDVSRQIGTIIPPGDYFVGMWNFELSMENRSRAIYSPWIKNKNINQWFIEEGERTPFFAIDDSGREIVGNYPSNRVALLREIKVCPVLFSTDKYFVNVALYHITPTSHSNLQSPIPNP